MASDYGLNFGFRRSDESVAVREGRLKTPVAGDPIRLGTLVQFDPSAAGYLKQCADDQIGEGATVGLLVQEEIWNRSIYETMHLDSFGLGVAYRGRPSVIVAGAGTKVWFKNTGASTRADGRVIAAVSMVDLTTSSPAILDYLKWDVSALQFVKGSGPTDSMLRLTAIDVAGGTCEAVLIR
jgi:hypothetical protein